MINNEIRFNEYIKICETFSNIIQYKFNSELVYNKRYHQI